MLVNGYIVSGRTLSRLHTWQFSDPVLHAFVVGALATILAYQATAVLLDLFLGGNKLGEVTVGNLFILLRTEDMSFRFLNQMFRKGDYEALNEIGKEDTSSPDTKTGGSRERHKMPAMIKLFVLLAAVPGINLFAIFLTLERDTIVSFREANFGGMSFGLPPNGSTRLNIRDVSQDCKGLVTKLDEVVQPMASFYQCVRSNIVELPNPNDPLTRVILEARANGEIEVRVLDGSADLILVGSVRLDVEIEGQFYRIPHSVTPEQATELVTAGGEILSAGCTPSDGREEPPPVVVTREGRRVQAEQVFTCAEEVPATMEDAFYGILLLFEAIEDSNLLVASLGDTELGLEKSLKFESGEDLPFYKWRGSYASFPILAILVACVVAARFVVMLFTHNDIHLGIELIIKDQLGLKFADSMLQNRSAFQYENINIWGRVSE